MNTGTFNFDGGTLSGSINNEGTFLVYPSTVASPSGYTQSAGTTTVNGRLNDSTIVSGGVLNGTGVIGGNVTVKGGEVLPGASATPGTLTVTGSYTQQSGGSLGIPITGAGQSSVLSVDGATALSGTLAMLPSSSYASAPPAIGDSASFLTLGGPISGQFTTTPSTPALGGGEVFGVDYFESGYLAAVVALPQAPAIPPRRRSAARRKWDTLTAATGAWTNVPTEYTYRWRPLSTASNCVRQHRRRDVQQLPGRRERHRAHATRRRHSPQRLRLGSGLVGADHVGARQLVNSERSGQ